MLPGVILLIRRISLPSRTPSAQYRIGLANHVQCLILCPIGCGELKNPPYDVAEFFKEILEEPEFKDKYNEVVFAILDKESIRGNKHQGNFIPFFNVFNAEKIEQDKS